MAEVSTSSSKVESDHLNWIRARRSAIGIVDWRKWNLQHHNELMQLGVLEGIACEGNMCGGGNVICLAPRSTLMRSSWGRWPARRDFITNAPQDIDYLLKVVAEQQQVINRLQAALDKRLVVLGEWQDIGRFESREG